MDSYSQLHRLLLANEDPLSTNTFTDFFATTGSLIVLDNVAQGAEEILASRQAILPVDRSVRWNVRYFLPHSIDQPPRT